MRPPPEPVLLRTQTRHEPRGVVLALPGGAQESNEAVGPWDPAVLRMLLLTRTIGPSLHRRGVALWQLRYGVKGWNDADAPSPVPDARWALTGVRQAYPALPVVLLGHSMGARTAVRVADDPQVRGVVALAPWLPAEDPVDSLLGKQLHAAHGTVDVVTSAKDTRAFVDRARGVGADASYTEVPRAGHSMLVHLRTWNRFALHRSLGVLDAE